MNLQMKRIAKVLIPKQHDGLDHSRLRHVVVIKLKGLHHHIHRIHVFHYKKKPSLDKQNKKNIYHGLPQFSIQYTAKARDITPLPGPFNFSLPLSLNFHNDHNGGAQVTVVASFFPSDKRRRVKEKDSKYVSVYSCGRLIKSIRRSERNLMNVRVFRV